VDLQGSKYNKETKKYELIIDEKYLAQNTEAKNVCPITEIIKIEKVED